MPDHETLQNILKDFDFNKKIKQSKDNLNKIESCQNEITVLFNDTQGAIIKQYEERQRKLKEDDRFRLFCEITVKHNTIKTFLNKPLEESNKEENPEILNQTLVKIHTTLLSAQLYQQEIHDWQKEITERYPVERKTTESKIKTEPEEIEAAEIKPVKETKAEVEITDDKIKEQEPLSRSLEAVVEEKINEEEIETNTLLGKLNETTY